MQTQEVWMWAVRVYVEGAPAPTVSRSYKMEAEAKRAVERYKELVRTAGTTHKVRLVPLFAEAA